MLSKTNPLYVKSDALAKGIYAVTNTFPNHEEYGITSQIRRAGLSVVLNIVEGFARQSPKDYRRFLVISFGSFKEVKYLLEFSLHQEYLSKEDYNKLFTLTEEVAKILWSIIRK